MPESNGPGVFDLRDVVAKLQAEFAKPCHCGHTQEEHPNYLLWVHEKRTTVPCGKCDCEDFGRD
jgi:hypothetical protein